MKNIIYLSGRNDFARVRVGIGKKPHPDYDLAKWVLSKFTNDERNLLETAIENAANAALMIADGEVDKAMNKFNK